jgi:hypothetical protein
LTFWIHPRRVGRFKDLVDFPGQVGISFLLATPLDKLLQADVFSSIPVQNTTRGYNAFPRKKLINYARASSPARELGFKECLLIHGFRRQQTHHIRLYI